MAYSPRLLLAAARNWKRVVPLMRDGRVPLVLKIGAGVLAALIVSPFDVFGDIPIIGLFDDALLLTLLCSLFVHVAGRTAAYAQVPVRVDAS
ncbi:MAG: hypothetical protein ABR508_02960 [Candidatus Baltobacteraceae bacterium]